MRTDDDLLDELGSVDVSVDETVEGGPVDLEVVGVTLGVEIGVVESQTGSGRAPQETIFL